MKKAKQLLLLKPMGLLAVVAFFLLAWIHQVSAATAEGITVTEAMIQQEIAFLKADAARRNLLRVDTQPQLPDRQELVSILSDRLLLLKEASRRRIRIKPSLVKKAWNDFLHLQKQDPAGLFARLEHHLARRRIKEGLLIERLLQRVVLRDIRVEENEIAAFYENDPNAFQTGEMIRARHIMIKLPPQPSEEIKLAAYEKLSLIQQKILDGANFAALAIRYSDCPSKSRGGDLGYFTRDQVIPEFAAAAFSLSLGQLSTIVQSRYGYHLIQVLDVKPAGFLTLKQARPLIKRYLYRQKAKQAVESFLKQLRQSPASARPTS